MRLIYQQKLRYTRLLLFRNILRDEFNFGTGNVTSSISHVTTKKRCSLYRVILLTLHIVEVVGYKN